MQFLRHIPLVRKLTFLLLLASVAALTLAACSFFTYQWFSLRRTMEGDLRVLSGIVAANAPQLITTNNVPAAKELLTSLATRPGVLYSSIAIEGQADFASYGKLDAAQGAAVKSSRAGIGYDGPFLVMRQQILQGKRLLGTLVIVFDFEVIKRRLIGFHLIATTLILAISAAFCLFLASKMQRAVSDPILDLLNTAKGITDRKDYALRAPAGGNDEIGAFTRAFNGMLDEIQLQALALQKAPEELNKKVKHLEHEISERKRMEQNLRAAELKYRALVEQLPVITYNAESNNSASWFYVSPQIETILGFSQKEWIANPEIWQERLHADDLEIFHAKAEMMDRNGDQFICEYRLYDRYGRLHWFRDQAAIVHEPIQKKSYTHGFLLDVTEQKQAEMELDAVQGQLLDISRQAGMAEVATGVLHNVGNVLNSVNVSATVLGDLIRNSKQASLGKVTALLREHASNLGKYISSDPKGKLLPTYLTSLTEHLSEEHIDMLDELHLLMKNIEHIKDIVSMQQSYAKVSGMLEEISPIDMVDDALQINAPSFTRNGIKIAKRIEEKIPTVAVEKHKVLQILVNLLRNAKNAMEDVARKDRHIGVDISTNGNNRVKIKIRDQGCGIAPENLTRIFSHGFTTKSDGHGFGLHIGALAAQEMGGSLIAESDGPGKGAVFVLELPIANPKTLS